MSRVVVGLGRETPADMLASPTGAHESRRRLLHAAHHLGLQPEDVIRLSEAVAGCPWESCGTAEVSLVAEALLEMARRVRAKRRASRPTDG